jgi:hypothetical protein
MAAQISGRSGYVDPDRLVVDGGSKAGTDDAFRVQ